MNAWLAQHLKALHWAWQRLIATPVNTLLSLLAIGIALALPAGGQMLLGNTLQLAHDAGTGNAGTTPQLSLFMRLDADRKATEAIAAKLRGHGGVRAALLVTREETLQRMQGDASLRDIVAALPQNPYPDAFIVTPRDDSPTAMEQLRDEMRRWPRIEHVQLDSAWVRRLDAMLRLGRIGVALLAALLGVGLIAITFTTLRLQILARRGEIEVCRLLGATDGFIRRPFYYFGFLQGLAGGIVAWLIVYLIAATLRTPITELAALYDTALSLQPLPLTESLILLTVAATLGWLGAALSLGRYLREDTA